jgi:hypothetical protein
VATLIKNHYGDSAQTLESYAIGTALVAGGIGFLAKSFIKRGIQPDDRPFILSRRDKVIAVIIGAVFGFVVGLTLVGSGTFFALGIGLAAYGAVSWWRRPRIVQTATN